MHRKFPPAHEVAQNVLAARFAAMAAGLDANAAKFTKYVAFYGRTI